MSRILTRSLVPMAVIGAAGMMPATASALSVGTPKGPPTRVTSAEGQAIAEARALLGFGGIAPDLCRSHSCDGTPGAASYASAWAQEDWGLTPYARGGCSGEFGHGHRGSTQWACYGDGRSAGGTVYPWQVNVSAYGNQTYAHLY